MTSRALLSITGIYAFLNGVAALMVPEAFMSLFGAQTDAAGLLNLRYFGVVAVGLALVFWSARNLSDWAVVRPIHVAAFVSFFLAALVGLSGQMAGIGNRLAWGIVVIDVVFLAAFAYFLFVKRAT